MLRIVRGEGASASHDLPLSSQSLHESEDGAPAFAAGFPGPVSVTPWLAQMRRSRLWKPFWAHGQAPSEPTSVGPWPRPRTLCGFGPFAFQNSPQSSQTAMVQSKDLKQKVTESHANGRDCSSCAPSVSKFGHQMFEAPGLKNLLVQFRLVDGDGYEPFFFLLLARHVFSAASDLVNGWAN